MIYNKAASSLHRAVGNLLQITPPFKDTVLLQEVVVSSLFTEYPNNRDRYDWVVPNYFLVIECMGVQHESLQTFGGDAGEALMNFQTQKFRDSQKEQIAILNGWTYLAIPWTDEKVLTSTYLLELFERNLNPNPITEIQKPKKSDLAIQKQQEQKVKTREYRKKKYQEMKRARSK